MRKSPIYHFLELVKHKKSPGPQLSFAKALEEKLTSTTGDNYFLIPLPDVEPKLIIDRRCYSISQNHLSVFCKYKENQFGLTTYHYTAELRDNERQVFFLHVYYNRHGNYSHHLLQMQAHLEKQTVEVEDEKSIIALSGQYVVSLICEINGHLEAKTEALSAEIRALQDRCENTSKKLFGEHAEKNEAKIRSAYEEYCKLTSEYHSTLKELNLLTFDPDHNTENYLADILKKLQSGTILGTLLEKHKTNEKSVKPKAEKPIKNSQKKSIEKPKKEAKHVTMHIDSKPTHADEIKDISGELRVLKEINTVKALVRKFELTKRYIKIVDCTQVDTMIQLFTQLDHLVLTAQNKIEELIEKNILKDVCALFKIAGEVSGKMVKKAALANATDVLDYILGKYKKNIDLMVGLYPLIMASTITAKTLEKLLIKGANPNVVSVFGDSALMEAARTRDIEKMRILLKYKAFANYQRVKPTSTITIFESDPKKAEDARDLLSQALKLPSDLRTAICLTVLNRDEQATNLLLDNGADPLILEKDGFPAFSFCSAVSKNTYPLDDHGRAFLKFIFTKVGSNINMVMGKPGQQATLLHYATQFDGRDYLVELLKLGADPNVKRNYMLDPRQSVTAPAFCASRGFNNLVMLFIEYENVKLTIATLAEIILCTNDINLQKKIAKIMHDRFINETLMKDPSAINNLYGIPTLKKTMLHFAISAHDLQAVEQLIKLKADTNIRAFANRPELSITPYEQAQFNPRFNLLENLDTTEMRLFYS